VDSRWREHLYDMEGLREGIGWRGLSQRDPLVEYKREGFDMFQEMERGLREDYVTYIYRIQNVKLREEPEVQQLSYSGGGDEPNPVPKSPRRVEGKIGRNDPCPCGSGKKYKKCGMLKTPEHQRLMAENPNSAANAAAARAGATTAATGGVSAATAVPSDLNDADPSVGGADPGNGSLDGGSADGGGS
jgi:hypothetical protein